MQAVEWDLGELSGFARASFADEDSDCVVLYHL